MITPLERKIYNVFHTPNGLELIRELQRSLFSETPDNLADTNQYIRIDGKCQLVRDFVTVLVKVDKELAENE